MPVFGVDVSGFQGAPDYARVKAAGVAFVIAKATEGVGYVDPSYARNRQAIPDNGLVPGAYHFLRGTHDGPSQAGAFVKVADPHALHALDVECLGDVRATGRPLDIAGFVRRYQSLLPGHPLLIYTGRDFWRACASSTTTVSTLPLWAAGHVPNAYVPGAGSLAQQWAKTGGRPTSGLPWGGWQAWTICQFTDRATVPGIAGGVDGDAFNGTLADLTALTGQETDMPLTDAEITAIAEASARAVHSQQIYRETWTGADGNPHPLLFADALLAAARRPFPTAQQVVDAIKATLTALPAGTATIDDTTIDRIADAVLTKLGARLT